MNKTRRARRGGAGFLNMIGLKKKSPFTMGPTTSVKEAELQQKMKNLKKTIQTLEGVSEYEGINLSKNIKRLENQYGKLRMNLATLKGYTNVLNIQTNPGYAGGKRKQKTRKNLRRSLRRRLQK